MNPKAVPAAKPRRILRKREVRALIGLSGPTIDRLEKAGNFPARVWVTPNSVGWYSDEIETWRDSRPRVGAVQTEAAAAT